MLLPLTDQLNGGTNLIDI